MLTFENGLDIRTRKQNKPCIAKFHVGNGNYQYVIIGTEYGHIHTISGDVRTWGSYSGAYKFLNKYLERGSL